MESFISAATSALLNFVIMFYLIQGVRLFIQYIMATVSPNETDKMMKLKSKSLMVVFGSGGHTTEMLRMLSHDVSKRQVSVFDRYGKVYFVFGHSDGWSEGKVKDHFKTRYGIEIASLRNLEIKRLFRAREVK